MRRQPCLRGVALAVFALVGCVGVNAQASLRRPSYDEGYGGGGEIEAEEEEKPCFNDGYGAPCSTDALVAGATLPYAGRILAISTIGQDSYGSSDDYSDYGSDDGLEPCTCLHTWTDYTRGAACGENNHGCPESPCDEDAEGSWCRVAHSPCLQEMETHSGGWAYCEPIATATDPCAACAGADRSNGKSPTPLSVSYSTVTDQKITAWDGQGDTPYKCFTEGTMLAFLAESLPFVSSQFKADGRTDVMASNDGLGSGWPAGCWGFGDGPEGAPCYESDKATKCGM